MTEETLTTGVIAEVVETEVVTTALPTADELIALTKEEFDEFKVAFETALKAKIDEEEALAKAKVAEYVATFKENILPIIKYGAGAYILLKVANII